MQRIHETLERYSIYLKIKKEDWRIFKNLIKRKKKQNKINKEKKKLGDKHPKEKSNNKGKN